MNDVVAVVEGVAEVKNTKPMQRVHSVDRPFKQCATIGCGTWIKWEPPFCWDCRVIHRKEYLRKRVERERARAQAH